MKTVTKTIPASSGRLYEISAGNRLPIADFSGKVEIIEESSRISVLGSLQKGIKRIYALFVVCGNLDYLVADAPERRNSGKIYEAQTEIQGERLLVAGMRFENSNPLANELIFRVPDLYLVEKLLKMNL